MYKGYTNEELYELFRHPSNKKLHKFPEFLDSLEEKVCLNPKTKSLQSESESIITNDLESSSLQVSMDSVDSQSVEQTCALTNSTLMKEQTSSIPSLLSDEQSESVSNEDVQDLSVEMKQA